MKLIFAICALMAIAATSSAQSSQFFTDDRLSTRTIAHLVAHLTFTTPYFAIDTGSDAFRGGDSVVFINWGEFLTAKGEIDKVSKTSSVGKFTGIWTRNLADTAACEIYVINRTDSPCSLVSAKLESPKQHAALPLYDPKTVPRDDNTGKPMDAIVLNINSETVIINVGKASCRVGDTLLVVRVYEHGPHITGMLNVEFVYSTDAEAIIWRNPGGIRPEDYLFVINRADSNISLASVSFAEK